ncbi:MAG: hypothetical protein HFJ05_11520 [Eubacterium sp.]|nr:hypothetical protein [Eubacterium sp.]
MDQTGFFSNQGLEVDTVQNYTGFHTAADVYKLKAFRLINFKAFRDTGWILLNRLTLVLGENSSGKSALYQALQMVSDAYEYLRQEDKFKNLARMSGEVGCFEELCNKSAESAVVKMCFQFQHEKDILEYFVCMEPDEKDEFGRVTEVSGKQENVQYDFLQYYDSVNIFFLERKNDRKIPQRIERTAECLLASMRKFAQSFQTINAHRYFPERIIQFAGAVSYYQKTVGSEVYDMLYALSEIQGKKASMVQDWLSKFGYSYRFKMSGVNRGEFVLKDLKSGIESNLVDNGFGISQSLPLAVALETIDQKTILIDSPEAFLQTQMQSEMGDLLITGSENGRILLETGSEYLTLRIQRRVAEEVILKEEVTIYYIEETADGETVCRWIALDDNGDFQNTSEAFEQFFSSDFHDIEKLDEIRREKRKHEAKNCN